MLVCAPLKLAPRFMLLMAACAGGIAATQRQNKTTPRNFELMLCASLVLLENPLKPGPAPSAVHRRDDRGAATRGCIRIHMMTLRFDFFWSNNLPPPDRWRCAWALRARTSAAPKEQRKPWLSKA